MELAASALLSDTAFCTLFLWDERRIYGGFLKSLRAQIDSDDFVYLLYAVNEL